MNIRLQVFKGAAPMLDEGLLHNEQAIVAKDVDLRSGSLRALHSAKKVKDVPAGTRTIYWWEKAEVWLDTKETTHFVESALSDDAWNRLYSSREDSSGYLRIRYSVNGEQKNKRLGVEKPGAAPTTSTVSKTATTWTPKWGFFWEEPDGSISGTRQMFAEVNPEYDGQVVAAVPGSAYSIPAGIVTAIQALKPDAASASSMLIFFLEAWSSSGALLGRTYPDSSAVSADNDLFINGFKVSAVATENAGAISIALAYDETDVEEYTADRAYIFTYVDEIGEESAPSNPSSVLTVRPDVDVKVVFPVFVQPDDRTSIVLRRVYRTVTGNSGTEFQFVADVAISASEYVDNLTDLETGETVPSAGWDLPPEGLGGLASIPGGFYAAYSGKTVYFSAENSPHAWPEEYAVSCDADISGIAVVGTTIYVLTVERPELITVSSPANSERSKVPYAQSCTSQRSIVTASGGVLFASPDGICHMVGLEVIVLSQVYLSKEAWKAMQTDPGGVFRPEETCFAVYDDQLFIFTAGGSWTWDLVKPDRGLIELSQRASAATYVAQDDRLYLASGTELLEWNGGESALEARWRSKRFGFTRPIRFRRARVSGEGEATLILRNYDGTEIYRITRKTAESFLLPPLAPMRWIGIEIRSRATVTEVSLGTSSPEM